MCRDRGTADAVPRDAQPSSTCAWARVSPAPAAGPGPAADSRPKVAALDVIAARSEAGAGEVERARPRIGEAARVHRRDGRHGARGCDVGGGVDGAGPPLRPARGRVRDPDPRDTAARLRGDEHHRARRLAPERDDPGPRSSRGGQGARAHRARRGSGRGRGDQEADRHLTAAPDRLGSASERDAGESAPRSQVIWIAPTSFPASQAIRTGRSARRSRRSRQTSAIGRPRLGTMPLAPTSHRPLRRSRIATSTRSLGDRRRLRRTPGSIRRPASPLRTSRRRGHPLGHSGGTRPTSGPTTAPCARARSVPSSRSGTSRPIGTLSATSTWAGWRCDQACRGGCPQPSPCRCGFVDFQASSHPWGSRHPLN